MGRAVLEFNYPTREVSEAMGSPFPGMDPYIEGQRWPDFHSAFIVQLRSALIPLIRPKYIALVEERVYLEHDPLQMGEIRRPDLSLALSARTAVTPSMTGTALADPAVRIPLLMPREERETYLEVRLRDGAELVTVIELLSPANKRPGSGGFAEYLSKRDAFLAKPVHVVEIDLLRGGARLPMAQPLPAADYHVIRSREDHRPMADVWSFGIREPLPIIPFPLAGDDPDVEVSLQSVFSEVYELAGYDYSLNYDRELDPPFTAADAAWAREILAPVTR